MSETILFVVAFLLGVFVSSSVCIFNWYMKYSEYGGTIEIDEDTMVNRIELNDDMEDWAEQKWLIFKVAKSNVKLKRIGKTDPMSLENEK